MQTFTIGQLAQQSGVTVQTIRYYERRQLIAEPPRLASGYRQYSAADITRIKFIRRAQKLGFSLDEIAELLDLQVNSESVCSDVQEKAEAKIRNIETKIQMLRQIKETLAELVAACQVNEMTSACPILEAFYPAEDTEK